MRQGCHATELGGLHVGEVMLEVRRQLITLAAHKRRFLEQPREEVERHGGETKQESVRAR